MSREDDFFDDFNESPDDLDTGQDDTSEPLIEESIETELVFDEPEPPAASAVKPTPKKKAQPKPKAKKKVSKTARKPASKKPAKKKVVAKKKKKTPKPKK